MYDQVNSLVRPYFTYLFYNHSFRCMKNKVFSSCKYVSKVFSFKYFLVSCHPRANNYYIASAKALYRESNVELSPLAILTMKLIREKNTQFMSLHADLIRKAILYWVVIDRREQIHYLGTQWGSKSVAVFYVLKL